MSYAEESRTFSIQSENYALIGNRVIEVQAYLADYPMIESELVSGTIKITDPCLDPFELNLPAQASPEPYLYTGLDSRIEFMPESITVEPTICSIDYTCQV